MTELVQETTSLATSGDEIDNAQVSLAMSLNALYKRPVLPFPDREQTVRTLNALVGQLDDDSTTENGEKTTRIQCSRPPHTNVYGLGPLLISDLPEATRNEGVVVGIDEAGRGSVCGPMIYGAAFWNTSDEASIPKDFNDSKQLTEEIRARLLQKILDTPAIGFALRVLHASEISRNMLRPTPYNLNQMSHDAAIGLIRHLLKAGVKVATCYIDTVGNPESYRRRLLDEFPGIDFVVESKADAKYPCCSAASVVAKVVRDRMVENWEFSEGGLKTDAGFGSGYPSDPVCKRWMEKNLICPVFGFPDVVRFSWGPAKKALQERAVSITFAADEDEEDDENTKKLALVTKRQREQMRAFLGKSQPVTKKRRLQYFEQRKLRIVTKLG